MQLLKLLDYSQLLDECGYAKGPQRFANLRSQWTNHVNII